LRFEFDPGANYAGYLIFISENGYREYRLPDSGLEGAFGTGPGRSRVISLWNSGPMSQHYKLSMLRGPGNDVVERGGFLANMILSHFQPDLLPLRVDSLDPLRVTTALDRRGWLETPRVFLPGYRAEVDGHPAPVEVSPERLAMVPLPPGRHRVELRYVGTAESWTAFAVSAIAWCVFLGRGLWPAFRRRPI
jgi:hypothetical protein